MAHLLDTFVLVSVPGCGDAAVLDALGINNLPDPHSRAIPAECGLPRVAVVRDPYARAVALFETEKALVSAGRQQGGFGDADAFAAFWNLDDLTGFLERLVENRTARLLAALLPTALFLGPCRPIEALHIEALQPDWDALDYLPALTFPDIDLETPDLTDEQTALVETWAAEDFETYGYETVA